MVFDLSSVIYSALILKVAPWVFEGVPECPKQNEEQFNHFNHNLQAHNASQQCATLWALDLQLLNNVTNADKTSLMGGPGTT